MREAKLIRLFQPLQHAFTVGLAWFAACRRRMLQDDWVEARAHIEREIAVFQAGRDRRAGRREEATRHRAIAAAMYREMAMRFWFEQAEAKFESG